MKKEKIRNAIAIAVFYLIIVLGVIAVNARIEKIENNVSISENR